MYVAHLIIPRPRAKSSAGTKTLKNRILLENYYLPGDLEARLGAFVEHYNHRRYHESLNNLTPADVYFGRGQTILLEKGKDQTKGHRAPALATSRRRCLKLSTR